MPSHSSHPVRAGWVGLLAAGLLLSVTAGTAQGQVLDRLHFGLGYVANAPEAMGGGSAYVIWPAFGGIGLYVDAKFDVEDPSGDRAFRSDLTARELESSEEFAGARYLTQEFSFNSFNVAVIRPVSSALFLYAGGGIAQGESFRLYEQLIGDLGYAVWVAAPDEDETRVNAMAGIMLRLSSVLTTQFGFESQPSGVTAGVSLRLPPW